MFNDKKLPKELEDLSNAIRSAVTNSEKVKESLANLHRRGLMSPESFLALILKMQDLVEVVERSQTKKRKKKKEEQEEPQLEMPPMPQIVDGQRFSAKEIAFLHYCQEKFDEKDWLRKLRIKLDENS